MDSYCTDCAARLEAGAKFCMNCGCKVEGVTSSGAASQFSRPAAAAFRVPAGPSSAAPALPATAQPPASAAVQIPSSVAVAAKTAPMAGGLRPWTLAALGIALVLGASLFYRFSTSRSPSVSHAASPSQSNSKIDVDEKLAGANPLGKEESTEDQHETGAPSIPRTRSDDSADASPDTPAPSPRIFASIFAPGTRSFAPGFSATGDFVVADDRIFLQSDATASFAFSVPPGQTQTIVYGIPAGRFVNNAPLEIWVNDENMATITQSMGGLGVKTPITLRLWRKDFGPGNYILTLKSVGRSVNVYGLWLSASPDRSEVSEENAARTLPHPTMVLVPGDQRWHPTNTILRAGNLLTISATGAVFMGQGWPPMPPEGRPPDNCQGRGGFTARGLPCWSLIGRIGEQGKPFFVGNRLTLLVPASGRLFLGVNDDRMEDNSGNWKAVVTVQSASTVSEQPDTTPDDPSSADNQSLATFSVGGSPWGIAFDGSNIWTTDNGGNTVTELRAIDGKLLGTFTVGSHPSYVAFFNGNIWVANTGSNNVTELRASDGKLLGTFPVGNYPNGLAFDGANVWVLNTYSNSVTKLRARDGAPLGTFPVGSNPTGAAFDGTNVWVVNSYSNTAMKVRTSDGAVLGAFNIGENAQGAAFDGKNIWVADYFSNALTKLQASTGAVLGTFRVGAKPNQLALDRVNIWVANTGSNTVTKLEAATGMVLGTFTVGSSPAGIVCDGANIWVANTGAGTVSKIRAR